MAGHIEGEWNGDAHHVSNAFKVVIDVVAGVAVGASLVGACVADYRQQVDALVFGVFVENGLHFVCPLDDELLACFAASVSDVAVFEVRFFEERHVDKAHASEVETEEEYVACKVEGLG